MFPIPPIQRNFDNSKSSNILAVYWRKYETVQMILLNKIFGQCTDKWRYPSFQYFVPHVSHCSKKYYCADMEIYKHIKFLIFQLSIYYMKSNFSAYIILRNRNCRQIYEKIQWRCIKYIEDYIKCNCTRIKNYQDETGITRTEVETVSNGFRK